MHFDRIGAFWPQLSHFQHPISPSTLRARNDDGSLQRCSFCYMFCCDWLSSNLQVHKSDYKHVILNHNTPPCMPETVPCNNSAVPLSQQWRKYTLILGREGFGRGGHERSCNSPDKPPPLLFHTAIKVFVPCVLLLIPYNVCKQRISVIIRPHTN